MSRLFRHFALAAFVAVAAAAPAHADDFLKAIDDVPLLKGLIEQAEPVVFESDKGRVVRTVAEGPATKTAVQAFYVVTMPQLGWERYYPRWESLAFRRENEQLEITVEPAAGDGPVKVTFELVVKLASTRLAE